MGDENNQKPAEYDEALKKFLDEEEVRRKQFDTELEEKRRLMETNHAGELKLSKIRIEAEIARKKLAIDEEIKKKSAQLREECEEKIAKEKEQTEANIQQMIKDKTAELQRKIEALKSHYAQRNQERKQTYEEGMKRLEEVLANTNPDEEDEADRRQFLKKELVEFKGFPKTQQIADEDALRRMGVSINKNSICSAREYILYRGTCKAGECVVKIIVLAERHSNYRSNIAACSKILRNLCSGNNGEPRHPAFIKVHHFFISAQKTYCFMEECSTANLEMRAKAKQINEGQLKAALRQVLAGLEFMHARAIAHLNLRGESIIFTKDGAAKIVGLGYAEHYFNADTETFFKMRKVDRRREFLPAECYIEERYEPVPVDVYSFGFLLYACISDLSKKNRPKKIGHVEFGNLPGGPSRQFVEETCARNPAQRPKLGELKGKPYFA